MAFDYGQYFREIALTHDLTTLPEDRRWRLDAPPRHGAERHQVVLYLGCNVLRTSHLAQTATAVFDRLGVDYVAVGGPTYCCGIVHHQQGDVEAGSGMGRRTIELFTRFAPDEVVMWCPSCIHFYDDIQQARLPFPIRHTTEFLVDQLARVQFIRTVDATVALHRHVVGAARQREAQAGRRLLEAVPGLSFVETAPEPRYGRTCSPAAQAELGPEAWAAMARDEIERARAGGADTLATIYHGCQRILCAYEAERRIVVEHYLSVFARALGIEYEDRFKKYRLWQDPERVLSDMTPCQQASGVDPERAMALVMATFGPAASPPAGPTPS
jgi:heterodisulfide reductase subunit D